MEQSKEHNNGRATGLLRGAGTRMASWFYAMHRLLRNRGALISTIHQAKFATISLVKTDDRVRECIQDINDLDFWKALYQLLRAVFPALRALRYADSSKPMMDKIYMLCHRLTQALEASKECLNNQELFPGDIDVALAQEMNIIIDQDEDSDDEAEAEAGAEDEDEDVDMDMELEEPHDPDDDSLGAEILRLWKKREKLLATDFAITAWAMCVMPEVRKDCKERMTGLHRDAIDRFIEKMYSYDPTIDVDAKKDTFWTEFKAFQDQSHPFDKMYRWNSQDVFKGASHLWHEKYSDPYTEVVGPVGMKSTSKRGGIGPCERAWGGIKHIKSGKRKHLSAKTTEMQGIIYCTARIDESRIRASEADAILPSSASLMWTDDDINFDLQLENFGVDTTVLRSVSRNRVFRCWEEDWEAEARKKNDPIHESKLLQKYKDLVFFDPDNAANYTIHPGNMEFQRGRQGGWMIIGIPPDDEGLEEEPFPLGSMVLEMISETEQAPNITMLRQEDEEADEGAESDKKESVGEAEGGHSV